MLKTARGHGYAPVCGMLAMIMLICSMPYIKREVRIVGVGGGS